MNADPKYLSQQRFARYAERYVASPTHAKGTDLERLVSIADPQPDWIVLDVATGGGHTALRFAAHVAQVTATDLVPDMLNAAQASAASHKVKNVAFEIADAEDLPFQDGRFDLVTCRIAPHHFTDCARFVGECARVLRPPTSKEGRHNGMLIVQDHVLPDDRAAGRYIDAFERLRDPSHNRAFAQGEWIELFEHAGLTVTHTEQLTKQHQFMPWAERQDCTPETIARLVDMVDQASDTVREWMQPRDFGTPNATFVNHHIIVAGQRTE